MKNQLFNPDKHHRKSIRKKGFDYSREGLYFITICVHNKKCIFGEISVGANNYSPDNHSPDNHSPDNHSPDNHSPDNHSPQMLLNDAGRIANECWLNIPEHFPNVILHGHIIMPNHVHGIIEIVGAKNF
jgi:putative transposase